MKPSLYWKQRVGGLLACVVCGACVETGTEPVSVPLWLAGSEVNGAFEGRDGFEIELSSARLAFGPLTLCAGATAASLCETAHAEWHSSAIVDALDPTPRRAGQVVGVGGPVRSWMFELGFVSLLTQPEPMPTRAATELGHSVYLEGTARRAAFASAPGQSQATDGVADAGLTDAGLTDAGLTDAGLSDASRPPALDGGALPSTDALNIHFIAQIDVRQEVEAEQGVPVVSKSSNERFEQDLAEAELELLVRFDPRPWFEQIDFATAALDLGCTTHCELRINEGSQAYRALRLALVAGEHPRFVFGPHLAKR